MNSTNVQSLFDIIGSNGTLQGTDPGTSDKFKQIVSNMLAGIDGQNGDKTLLGDKLAANQELKSALYAAASMLYLMGNIQNTAVQSTDSIEKHPAVQNILNSNNFTADEKSTLLKGIKVVAIEISVSEATFQEDVPSVLTNSLKLPVNADNSLTTLDTASLKNNNAVNTNTIIPETIKTAKSATAVSAETITIEEISVSVTEEYIPASQTAAVSIGTPVPLNTVNTGNSFTTAQTQQAASIADGLKNSFISLKNAIENLFADRYRGFKQKTDPAENTAPADQASASAKSNAASVENSINAIAAAITQVQGNPTAQVQTAAQTATPVIITNAVQNIINAVQQNNTNNTIIIPVNVPASAAVAAQTLPVSNTAANRPVVLQPLNDIIRDNTIQIANGLNNVIIAVNAISVTAVRASAADSKTPVNAPIGIQAERITIDTMQVSAQLNDSSKQPLQASAADIKDSITKIVTLLNQLNGTMQVSNKVSLDIQPAAGQKAALPMTVAEIERQVTITAQNIAVADPKVTLTNTAAEIAPVVAQVAPEVTINTGKNTASVKTAVTEDVPAFTAKPEFTDAVKTVDNSGIYKSTDYKGSVEKHIADEINWMSNNIMPALKATQDPGAVPAAIFNDAAEFAISTRESIIVKQVADAVKSGLTTSGKTEIKMILKPENLGTVIVRIDSKDKVLSARIEVMNSDVKDALKAGLVDLKAAINNMGLDVKDFSVTITNQNAGNGFNDFHRQHAPEVIENTVTNSNIEETADNTALYTGDVGYFNLFA
jgi:flagellar hook-length control protein FliK